MPAASRSKKTSSAPKKAALANAAPAKRKAATRAPAHRAGLSRDSIVRAAVDLIDREGAEAFSMRRLGAVMGVQAMSFYNHFADRESLLGAVMDHLIAQIDLPPAKGRWRHRLVFLCCSIRATALRQPRVFELLMTQCSKPVSSLPLLESLHGALADAGLSTQEHVFAFRDIGIFINGFTRFELDHRRKPEVDCLPPRESMADYPHLLAIAPHMMPIDFDRQFEESLATILEGITAKARAARRAR